MWLVDSIDRMKDAVIAKLANQAADFYSDAYKQCQYKDNLPKVPTLTESYTHTHKHAPKTHCSALKKRQERKATDVCLIVCVCGFVCMHFGTIKRV